MIRGISGAQASKWLKKGGFAVLDQALFAGANFLASVLLARWLSPEQFGAFSIGYSVLLLLGAIHTAMLTEPMMVFGAGKYASTFHAYLRVLLYWHWGITLTLALALGLVALAFWRSFGAGELSRTFSGLAIALPFILFLWLLRRTFYVQLNPQLAAAGGVLYLSLMPTGLYLLHNNGSLSPYSAFLAMGFVSLTTAAVNIFLLRLLQSFGQRRSISRQVMSDHMGYSKWAIGASIVVWLSGNIQNFMVAAVADLSAAGALRALDNILIPFWQFQGALAGIVLPVFSQTAVRSAGSFDHRVRLISVFFALQAICAYMVLAIFGTDISLLLYQQRYQEYVYLLPWYALILLPESISTVLLTAHRAILNTRLVFIYHFVLLAGTLAAYPVILVYGLSGMVYSRIVISYILFAFLVLVSKKSRLELK